MEANDESQQRAFYTKMGLTILFDSVGMQTQTNMSLDFYRPNRQVSG